MNIVAIQRLSLVLSIAAVTSVGILRAQERRTNFGEQIYAEVRGYIVRPTEKDKSIPKELRISAKEAKKLNAKIAAEETAIGYVPKKGPYYPGHWFKDWPKLYWDSHREYFGLCPNGKRGVEVSGFPTWLKGLSKICVSNEETVRLRIETWVKAGKPECLELGENDGVWGFCRCEGCKALDADKPGEPFLATKTDRYLNYWNRVTAEARKLRPDVRVAVHLYNCFYKPPRREKIKYPDNMAFSFVTKFEDPDPVATVRAWKKAGMKYFYHRPNYLCNRSVFPMGREKFIWDIHRKMLEEGSKGAFYDANRGIPATYFDVYVAQRLCVDPNLTFPEIEREWCARHGKAAETVKAYYARVRERCDRAFSDLLEQRRKEGDEYLDDSHFSRHYHTFHRMDELKDDLALLESFDESLLDGEAKENFTFLKINARHYIITKKAHETDSKVDKKALMDFRVKNKNRLGTGWGAYFKKGEFWLWNKDPVKMKYEKSGSYRFVEKCENEDAVRNSNGKD